MMFAEHSVFSPGLNARSRLDVHSVEREADVSYWRNPAITVTTLFSELPIALGQRVRKTALTLYVAHDVVGLN